MRSRLTFHGGAGAVTGVHILLETGAKRFALDCGLLQREHNSHDTNYQAFGHDPHTLDALIVSHAHADHIGRIPRLVASGFGGAIYSTPATRDLAHLMFEDALRIMAHEESESGRVPLYTRDDVAHTFTLWRTHDYHERVDLGDEITCTFLDAGHILGSAMIKLERAGRTLVFTGDVGSSPEPLLRDTESLAGAQTVITESVYGDRVHEGRDTRREVLAEMMRDTVRRDRSLLIPAFSIERTQILLSEMDALVERGQVPSVPVYLDAPLGSEVTEVYRRYVGLLNSDMQARFKDGGDPFMFPGLTITRTTKESDDIHHAPNPKIIVAGSGMSSGGRIRAHEAQYLPQKDATILFVGYQVPGSLGRRIEDGARSVEIDGVQVKVRAEIARLSGYSGHKDRNELLAFLETGGESLEKVYVALGEPKSAGFLAQRVQDFLGVSAIVPEAEHVYEVDL